MEISLENLYVDLGAERVNLGWCRTRRKLLNMLMPPTKLSSHPGMELLLSLCKSSNVNALSLVIPKDHIFET